MTKLCLCIIIKWCLNRSRCAFDFIDLISPPGGEKPCTVICTHVHFDHSGGAHHFEDVRIHEDDRHGLKYGRQTEILNYVKSTHFYQKPYEGFSPYTYKVPATACTGVRDGEQIDLGEGDYLQIIHTPGHTKGSISIYRPSKRHLFTGDFVYDCGPGSGLLDWLPTSCVRDYLHSARSMLNFMQDNELVAVFPGHFKACSGERAAELLNEYVEAREDGSICGATCLQALTFTYFLLGCFRCCPCWSHMPSRIGNANNAMSWCH